MFRLLRYYSLASAAVIALVTLALSLMYHENAEDEMLRMAEQENIALARAFANTIWPQFSEYLSRDDLTAESVRTAPETPRIHDVISTLIHGLPVLKVKIYNFDGLTVYSSEASQIGDDKSANAGFRKSVLKNLPVSSLTFRDNFSAFEGRVTDRNFVESYIPISHKGGRVSGVFELYTDVTPLISRIETTTTNLTVSLLLIFSLLYGVLYLIVLRADRIMKKQYVDLQSSETGIKAKNQELEKEVEIRKRIEAELSIAKDQSETANRAKSEFLANMSHELRTPLNAILGFSETIQREIFGPLGNEKYKEYAGHIHESGGLLVELINDILDLSKVEAGKMELHETRVNIAEIIDSVILVLKERVMEAGIRLETDLPDDLPVVYADQRMLKQILLNLVSNAVKFTESGGHITIKGNAAEDKGISLTVTDSGIGIAPEDIPKALSTFGQVENPLTQKNKGTGLGLPLTQRLVELHGGEFELKSELGVGTSVQVRLPPSRLNPKDGGEPAAE